jgi:hypothetical protein
MRIILAYDLFTLQAAAKLWYTATLTRGLIIMTLMFSLHVSIFFSIKKIEVAKFYKIISIKKKVI